MSRNLSVYLMSLHCLVVSVKVIGHIAGTSMVVVCLVVVRGGSGIIIRDCTCFISRRERILFHSRCAGGGGWSRRLLRLVLLFILLLVPWKIGTNCRPKCQLICIITPCSCSSSAPQALEATNPASHEWGRKVVCPTYYKDCTSPSRHRSPNDVQRQT